MRYRRIGNAVIDLDSIKGVRPIEPQEATDPVEIFLGSGSLTVTGADARAVRELFANCPSIDICPIEPKAHTASDRRADLLYILSASQEALQTLSELTQGTFIGCRNHAERLKEAITKIEGLLAGS